MTPISDDQILGESLKHSFWTWSAQGKVNPIPVRRAEGVYFWDVNDRRYLDFNSMVMNVNIGHGNPTVIAEMIRQIQDLPYAGPGMATRPRAELGELLSEIVPAGLDYFLYTLGGADANENAVKLARGYTGRFKVLARYRSYHGATYGAVALSGDPRRVAWEPATMPGVVHFLDPYRYRSTFHRTTPDISEAEFTRDYLNHLEEIILYEGPQTIAAVLMETVTGTNGVIIPPAGYLAGVRALCDRYGILLICDEVMSGFGRTGKWFAVDHWDVKPDLMTMAKGLTSGYAPLGAVAMRKEIRDAFAERVYEGGLTYNSHPVSLAAAIGVIRFMQSQRIVEHAAEMGKLFSEKLTWLQERHPSIGETRSIGLFGILEIVKDRATREPAAAFNQSSPLMVRLRQRLLERGLYVYTHWHTVLLLPPLIITPGQLEEGFAILDEVLTETDQNLVA